MDERKGQGIAYPTLPELEKIRPEINKAEKEAMKQEQTMVDNLFRIANNQQTAIRTLQKRLDLNAEMMKAMGYTSNLDYTVWSHATMQACPACGGIPVIQKYQFDNGGWIAICSQCSHRTEAMLSPNGAVKAWNAGEFTYLSKMTQNRLDGSPRERRKRHDDDDA